MDRVILQIEIVREEKKDVNGCSYVSIEVTDQDVGIPNNVLGMVFDPFFSTKPGGSGLGLSISDSIVM